MTRPIVENRRNRMRMPIPWVFLLVAGFVCADKCKMSKNYADSKTSLQDGGGIGLTAESFQDLYNYICLAPPSILILENLKDLLTPTLDTKDLSVAAYIIRKLMLIGFSIVSYFVSKAEQVGSACVRWRIFFIAIRRCGHCTRPTNAERYI